MQAYAPRKTSRSTFVRIRDLDYHLRAWGDPAAPLLVMVHGWMDVSASFQFLVDELAREWHVVSPDWRGYGLTGWSTSGCYWMPDYVADLDAILGMLSPDAPVRLVAHSLGGNVALMYAGARPDRIGKLVNLEGLGMTGDAPQKAPARLAKWMSELREPPTLSDYPSLQAVVARLRKTNPRLREDRAAFLAQHWSAQTGDGRYRILGDPAHKVINPYVHRVDEVTACWAAITAPVLWIMARDSDYAKRMDASPGYGDRIASIAAVERLWIADAGHMLHHDQPERLAVEIERFLA
ncbi:MAG: alpha/beta hydrolase [Burkholderiaceae bacterium]